jgi:hypothetical protein|tara:strand:+ start:108 stop:476 length:369 start_codon:yes stop_codon:yes gene_type:complete
MATVNLDTAARLDITCRKGDSFQLVLDFGSAVPTTGWKLDVDTADDGGTSVLPDSVFTYTVSNGDATDSKLTIEASSTDMNVNSGLYVYDIQNTDSGVSIDSANKVKTYVFGTFKINEDVSA